ncbi:MAG: dUTP diphosphatase [Acholeplasmataceae bacterium]|jgi:dUTP pyrophosphatase|nr:dUTP diphosphatase [Acholeplasmataceae bacterium]
MAVRGFEIVSAYQKEGIRLPKRSTINSAGYDLEAAVSAVIPPKNPAVIPTGIKAFMAKDEVLIITPRSSLFSKKKLIMTNSVGIIDADYYNNPDNEGHIRILLYNLGDLPTEIKKGERLVQAVFTKFLLAGNEENPGATRTGGIGSTN